MKVLLAGAFGNLGFELLKVLAESGYEVVAADLKERKTTALKANTPSVPSMQQIPAPLKAFVTALRWLSRPWDSPQLPPSSHPMTSTTRAT